MSLTDQEVAHIREGYDALIGVEPDGFSWEHLDKVPNKHAWVAEKADMWRKDGMTYLRVTVEEETNTIWLEVWKKRPVKEAPFKGHYTVNGGDSRG